MSTMWDLDETDIQILHELQGEARVSNAELARRIGLVPSATLERMRKLEQKGYLAGFEVTISPKKVGLTLLAFVNITFDEQDRYRETVDMMAAIPEVQEVHLVAGASCCLLKVRARDPEDLNVLIHDRIARLPGVGGTNTTIVLRTAKETRKVPLPDAPHPRRNGSKRKAVALNPLQPTA